MSIDLIRQARERLERLKADSTQGEWVAQFGEWLLYQGEVEAVGIELELVEPDVHIESD